MINLPEGIKIEEAKRRPSFGTAEKKNYAVQINALDSNEFYKQSFGRSWDDRKRVDKFIDTAHTQYIDTKGMPTKKAVRDWVKNVKPDQFYASWTSDSKFYKDDNVKIYYL
jgi:hypothetical protein